MRELVTLGPWLRRFLTEHIVTERNLARNTRTSYRDTFSLLLPFISGKVRKPVDRLAVADLTSGRVLQFLAHLEEERGCCARTRNQRDGEAVTRDGVLPRESVAGGQRHIAARIARIRAFGIGDARMIARRRFCLSTLLLQL